MLGGEVLDLVGLLANDVTSVLKVGVNDILVLDVDEGSEIDGACEEQSEAPKGKPLDENVRGEEGEKGLDIVSKRSRLGRGNDTYTNRCPDVLGEDDALELNHKEVDELLKVVEEALERLLGDGQVFARSHPGSQAISKQRFSSNLGRRSDCAIISQGLVIMSRDC